MFKPIHLIIGGNLMQAQEIENHLAELGRELQIEGVQQPVRILLIGGAFMLTQIHNRANTNDIDVLLKDVDDSTTSLLYRNFKNAVRTVASKQNIPVSWLNDVIGDFIRDIGNVPEGILWKTFDVLEVYIPPSDYILALKLLAGRFKDEDDIVTLCGQLQIQTREQAQALVDRYIPNKQVQQINDLDDKLIVFFPDLI